MPPFAGRPNAALLEESRDAASRTADERPAVKMRNACGLDSPFGILLRAAPGKNRSGEPSHAPGEASAVSRHPGVDHARECRNAPVQRVVASAGAVGRCTLLERRR